MNEAEKIVTTIFGGIIALAVLSVLVGSKSQAPQVINAFGSALGNVVGQAVAPANNGANTFSLPHL